MTNNEYYEHLVKEELKILVASIVDGQVEEMRKLRKTLEKEVKLLNKNLKS